MKYNIKTKNGSQHSPKHISPKKRISKIFRRRNKKHINPSQKEHSSNKPMLICSRSDGNSNDNILELKNPNNAQSKLEDNHLLSTASNINENSNIITNENMQPNSGLNIFSNLHHINNNNNNEIRFNDNNSNDPSLHESTNGFNTIEEIRNENNFDHSNRNNTRESAADNDLAPFGNVNENTNGNIIPNYNANHNINNRNNDNYFDDITEFLFNLEFMNYMDESLRRLSELIIPVQSAEVDKNILKPIKRNLPKIKYKENEESKCVICIEDFKKGQTVYRLTCNHIFHVRCLNKELKKRLKCPLCREAIT